MFIVNEENTVVLHKTKHCIIVVRVKKLTEKRKQINRKHSKNHFLYLKGQNITTKIKTEIVNIYK